MDPLFAWIEQTVFSTWMRESPSLLAFPAVLVLHTVGMAFLAGANAALDLRVLGFASRVPLWSMERFFPVMWFGFWLNAASGVALLIAYPTKALTNPVFYLKLAFIAAALMLTAFLRNRALRGPILGEFVPMKIKIVAATSLVLWIGAITAGRLLAYTYSRLTVDF